MVDRMDERPETEPYFWNINNFKWPVNGKTKPGIIILDPPYFSTKAIIMESIGVSPDTECSKKTYHGYIRFQKGRIEEGNFLHLNYQMFTGC